jgi:hypothetical protein
MRALTDYAIFQNLSLAFPKRELIPLIPFRNAVVANVARDGRTGIVAVCKDPQPRCGWK